MVEPSLEISKMASFALLYGNHILKRESNVLFVIEKLDNNSEFCLKKWYQENCYCQVRKSPEKGLT